jgi:GMP synthase (glutamine-hydrolysing)
MGGPMGVYEHDKYPWIACQKKRLASRLAPERPTLGVCFGAQLLASALGARVYPGPVKEVGFHPLTIVDAPAAAPLRRLEGVPVLHWHGDTFELPEGAELLASSECYAHQAFAIGPNILALQFHAEMGVDERFDTWVEQWPDDIAAAGTSAEQLRADHARHGAEVVAAGRAMIADWLAALR